VHKLRQAHEPVWVGNVWLNVGSLRRPVSRCCYVDWVCHMTNQSRSSSQTSSWTCPPLLTLPLWPIPTPVPNHPKHKGAGTTARHKTAWKAHPLCISFPFKASMTTMKTPPPSCPAAQHKQLPTSAPTCGPPTSTSISSASGTKLKLAAPRTDMRT